MITNCYQKFYTNQIHSSSLLCQLATMWKSQVLCDAIIKSGSTVTKAHRVVLVAACPMLQSMEKSSVGSHLEVRLASDIKPEAVYTFLQYLYEGFMMLTEENCKDVEKIARLLQVDSVIKCCADFNKCLSLKTGNANLSEQYRYTFHDMIEFRHVRSSEMQKTVQDKLKRPLSDFHRPGSPSMKRAKHYRTGSPCDISVIADRLSMAQSYATQDRIGNSKVPSSAKFSMGGKTSSYPIEVVEDSIELVQTETDQESDTVKIDEAVSVGISSQINNTSDLQVIDVSKQTQHSSSVDVSQNKKSSPNNSITVSPLDTFPSTSQYTETNVTKDTPPQSMPSPRTLSTPAKPLETVPTPQSKSLDRPPGSMQLQTIPQMSRPPLLTKSFAAGSPLQSTHADGTVQPVYPVSYSSSSTSLQGPPASIRSPVISENSTVFESRKDGGFTEKPDLSIVKVEAADEENTGSLDMYIDTSEGRVIPHNSHRVQDDTSDTEANTTGEWTREEIMSEEGNISGDQSSWMDHSFKGHGKLQSYMNPEVARQDHSSPLDLQFCKKPILFSNRFVSPTNAPRSLWSKNDNKSFGNPQEPQENDFIQTAETIDGVSENSLCRTIVEFDNTLTMTDFEKLEPEIKFMDPSRIHVTESLQGKQKYCRVCKYKGRRTNDGTLAVRTRAKCSVCDIPLCKGPPRNCFRDFHEMCRSFKYHDLQWALI